MKRLLSIVLFGIFLNFHSIAQITISAPGPTDVCFTPVTLNVVNPQPGYVYDWYVSSYVCAGSFGSPMGPYATGDVMQAYGTGEFVCYGTGPSGIPEISNPLSIRTMPGSVGFMHLPLPYPTNQVTCTPSVALCIPTAFYQNFTTTINWYKDNVQIAGASSPDYLATTPGWYKYTITSPCATDYSDSVYFSPGAVVPVITGINTICQGLSTVFNAGGGYATYLWSTGANTQTLAVNAAGIYTVTVTDGAGCTATSSRTLTVNPNPVPSITGTNNICTGSNTAFCVSSPFSCFIWSNGATTQCINLNNAGSYTVTVCDANGCTGTATLTLTINPLPAPQITGDSTICPGQITVLDAGAGYAAYFWSTGDVTQTTNVGGIGTYSVTVLDANGCTGTDSFTVLLQPPYPTVLTASGPLGICQGDSVQLFAQTPMNSFQWYRYGLPVSGATTSSLWVSGNGRFRCLSVDAAGCPASSNQVRVAVVCIPPLPPAEKQTHLPITLDLFQISPNPSTGIFYYKVDGHHTTPLHFQVTDLIGNILIADVLSETQGVVDLSAFQAGIYLLKVKDANSALTLKLVKTN